ncbi:MAG: toll/interleukin-1 receptor domain-containing protein [Cyclobacteriaceae bacterium]
MRQNKYEYDAFISHAVEDKIPIANELCAKLERAGLKIWYSGKELGIGDSIEKTIEKGLNRSRYGIVIFSPTYLAKNWTIREFYTLLAKEIEEQKVILPVLYNITLDELKNKDLVMADRFAVNSDKGIDFVVERLVREIKKSYSVQPKEAWFSKIWFVLILSLLANVGLLLKGTVFPGSRSTVVPSHSILPINSAGQANAQSALFSEMQALFKQLNTCNCNNHKEQGLPPVVRSGFTRSDPLQLRPGGNDDQRDQSSTTQPGHRMAGSKMTMALVFQIETAPETPAQLEGEIDEMLNMISMHEQKDAFVTVKNIENSAFQTKRDCVHTSNLGD